MKDTVDEGNYTLLYSGCGTVGDYLGQTVKDTVDEGNYTLLYSGCGTVGDYVGQTVKDTVDEGNYTYYTLKQPGPLELVLTTFQGNTYG